MISATRKWIFLKVSGALLVPLMIWFILNLIMIYDEEYLKFIRELRNDVHRVQNRKWGWSLAAQFLFGARTSES